MKFTTQVLKDAAIVAAQKVVDETTVHADKVEAKKVLVDTQDATVTG